MAYLTGGQEKRWIEVIKEWQKAANRTGKTQWKISIDDGRAFMRDSRGDIMRLRGVSNDGKYYKVALITGMDYNRYGITSMFEWLDRNFTDKKERGSPLIPVPPEWGEQAP